ncbi:MAG TPA: glycosyltransferase family 4 protein [Methylomirabilota bacterium]
MKLALICRPFVFHGGVETATAGLVRELVRRDHEVDLLTTRAQRPVPGVTVRPLPVLRGPRIARVLSFGLAARMATRGHGYEVVQAHERTFAADLYRAGEGTHRGYLEAMGRSQGLSSYHKLLIYLERRIFQLRAVNGIVAISAGGKTEIERLYGTPPERVTLIYNGVDLDRFTPDNRTRHRAAIRAELGVDAADWCVLFVGSGFERKGLGPLVEALGSIGDRHARLIVAGRGNRAPYVTQAARLGLGDRVVWTAPRPDVDRLYAAADLVALPARYEPFGNVHLEALASGVPVLSSVHAGGAELIRNGVNGWVAEEVSGPRIAEGLERLRSADAGSLATQARASAEPYPYAAQAERFEALYRRNPAFH